MASIAVVLLGVVVVLAGGVLGRRVAGRRPIEAPAPPHVFTGVRLLTTDAERDEAQLRVSEGKGNYASAAYQRAERYEQQLHRPSGPSSAPRSEVDDGGVDDGEQSVRLLRTPDDLRRALLRAAQGERSIADGMTDDVPLPGGGVPNAASGREPRSGRANGRGRARRSRDERSEGSLV